MTAPNPAGQPPVSNSATAAAWKADVVPKVPAVGKEPAQEAQHWWRLTDDFRAGSDPALDLPIFAPICLPNSPDGKVYLLSLHVWAIQCQREVVKGWKSTSDAASKYLTKDGDVIVTCLNGKNATVPLPKLAETSNSANEFDHFFTAGQKRAETLSDDVLSQYFTKVKITWNQVGKGTWDGTHDTRESSATVGIGYQLKKCGQPIPLQQATRFIRVSNDGPKKYGADLVDDDGYARARKILPTEIYIDEKTLELLVNDSYKWQERGFGISIRRGDGTLQFLRIPTMCSNKSAFWKGLQSESLSGGQATVARCRDFPWLQLYFVLKSSLPVKDMDAAIKTAREDLPKNKTQQVEAVEEKSFDKTGKHFVSPSPRWSF